MKLAVCAILPVMGMFLTVSRKDDHTKFGLIGGKVDDGETLETALKREVLEETGLHVNILSSPFIDNIDDFKVHTYIVELDDKYHQSLDSSETGLIKLNSKDSLIDESVSPFYKYNIKVFEHFGY